MSTDAVAKRYNHDGYGWHYVDSGSGSYWRDMYPNGEFLYTKESLVNNESINNVKNAIYLAKLSLSNNHSSKADTLKALNLALDMLDEMEKEELK
jgi:hypothetical protein